MGFWDNVMNEDVRLITCLVERAVYKYWPETVGESVDINPYKITLVSKQTIVNKLIKSELKVTYYGK